MTRADLWPRVEPLLGRVERPARYINREWGSRHDDADYRSALLYPDTYEIGQANQAVGILYERLNAIPGVTAERVYVPWIDMSELMRTNGVPLFSLESCLPVSDVDLLGITIPYELTYTNILEAIDLAGLALRAADRVDGDALVIGGGPGVYNPEPIAPFFDAILIGEGEEAICDIVSAHRAAKARGASRSETLADLARVRGVYVPSLYEPIAAPDGSFSGVQPVCDTEPVVLKRVVAKPSEYASTTCPIVPFMDVVHDRFTVEVLRGCSRGCRFCQAGMVYRPVRERDADSIVRDVMAGLRCTGYDEASLTSLSTTDHSQLEDILRRLQRRLEGTGISVSVPSLRVDSFSVDMARLIATGKKTGLTFAPEAGTQRLRDVINKNVTDEDLLGTVRAAFEAGWRRIKLYFMIGLPTETDEDVSSIGDLVRRVLEVAREATPAVRRSGVRVGVSVSTFVPKAGTPFQWEAQDTIDEIRRKQAILRESMPRKGVDLHWHDAQVSFLEGVMARGGRELAAVIETAWRSGARFDAWTERFDLRVWSEALEANGVEPGRIANRARDLDEPLAWDHISSGVSRRYLLGERERAYSEQTTPDCTFSGCTGCDACDDLGVGNVIASGARR